MLILFGAFLWFSTLYLQIVLFGIMDPPSPTSVQNQISKKQRLFWSTKAIIKSLKATNPSLYIVDFAHLHLIFEGMDLKKKMEKYSNSNLFHYLFIFFSRFWVQAEIPNLTWVQWQGFDMIWTRIQW